MTATTQLSVATGTALRTLRLAAGLTVRQTAAAAGVSTGYLSKAENGIETPSSKWVHTVITAIGEHIEAKAS